MPGFLKVRATAGPKHVFYAPVESVEAWPDDYEVLDESPVAEPGQVEYVEAAPVAEKASSKAFAVVDKSVGDEKEGDA
jgi:hypothetical protein